MALSTLTSGIDGPAPLEVGQLWFELTAAFAVGLMAEAHTDAPERVANGQALQIESAMLLDQVSTRLGIVVGEPETGAVAALGKGAKAAWIWLRGASRPVVKKAAAAAKGSGGAIAAVAVLGGVTATGLTAYDWVMREEQTRREAIKARKDVELALVARMPKDQVAGALKDTADRLDALTDTGMKWWHWALLAGGAVGGYKLATAGSKNNRGRR